MEASTGGVGMHPRCLMVQLGFGSRVEGTVWPGFERGLIGRVWLVMKAMMVWRISSTAGLS
jgi:hypothetical protein